LSFSNSGEVRSKTQPTSILGFLFGCISLPDDVLELFFWNCFAGSCFTDVFIRVLEFLPFLLLNSPFSLLPWPLGGFAFEEILPMPIIFSHHNTHKKADVNDDRGVCLRNPKWLAFL